MYETLAYENFIIQNKSVKKPQYKTSDSEKWETQQKKKVQRKIANEEKVFNKFVSNIQFSSIEAKTDLQVSAQNLEKVMDQEVVVVSKHDNDLEENKSRTPMNNNESNEPIGPIVNENQMKKIWVDFSLGGSFILFDQQNINNSNFAFSSFKAPYYSIQAGGVVGSSGLLILYNEVLGELVNTDNKVTEFKHKDLGAEYLYAYSPRSLFHFGVRHSEVPFFILNISDDVDLSYNTISSVVFGVSHEKKIGTYSIGGHIKYLYDFMSASTSTVDFESNPVYQFDIGLGVQKNFSNQYSFGILWNLLWTKHDFVYENGSVEGSQEFTISNAAVVLGYTF